MIIQRKTLIGCLIGFALLLPLVAGAQTQGGGAAKGSQPWSFIGRKADVKRQGRWSLDEWMATREKFKWQDMWLALNSPSPFEFFISGAYNLVPLTQQRSKTFNYGAGAYVSIFGLEYQHETILNAEDHARFHLRLFGYNVQNTNLTFQAGIRFQSSPSSYRQGYLGLSTTIYLQKYFGIYALYRHYLSTISVPTLGVMTGTRAEAGPFIDFGPFRVYGFYLVEVDQNETSTYRNAINGWTLGGQLFF